MHRKIILTLLLSVIPALSMPEMSWCGPQSGARILGYPVSARALGMGEAFCAVADDVYAMHYNPAGLNQIPNYQVGMTYFQGLEDTFYTHLGFAMPIGMDASWGLGVGYLDGGTMLLTATDGSEREVKALADYVVSATAGLRVYGQNMVGVSVKYMSSKLAEEYSGTALAFDAGILYELTQELRFGFALKNVGAGIKYDQETDPLPTTLTAGLFYPFALETDHILNTAIEINKPLDLDYQAHVGIEYVYQKFVFARAGYKYGYDLEGLTCGAGVEWQFLQLDYALAFRGAMGMKHHASLTFKF